MQVRSYTAAGEVNARPPNSTSRWHSSEIHSGGDACSRVYLAHCEAMRRSPPGPGWDGVFEMKSK